MTIQEQLEKLNSTFEKLHMDFIKLDSDKQNLDKKYASIIANVKASHHSERALITEQQEEVLKYYRIAKDNSNKELVHSGVIPQRPNLAILNTMIERVDSYSRTDPIAGQIIDLCNAYNAFLELEIKKVDMQENTELQNINRNKIDELNNIVYRKRKVLQDCEDYLKGDDLKNLVSLFEIIHKNYEITKDYLDNWTIPSKQKKMMLLGFSDYRVDVPQRFCPILKNSLGRYFDEKTKMVNSPFGFTTDTSEEIFIEYTDINASRMKNGIQALILNFLRYFKPTEFKISVLDYIHYNADVLGILSIFASGKNGLISNIPSDEKELKQSVSLLANYYRKVEAKIGTQNLYEYNRTHKSEERIPYRILIINRIQESFNSMGEAEMSYVINNAAKFGIVIIRMTKSMDGGSKGKDREKKYLVKASDYIRIISDATGFFYVENDKEWLPFKWLTAPDSIPKDFVLKVQNAVKPVEFGTKYFKRYKPKMPERSLGKRKPVNIPFAINEDDRPINCSFENELFATYINGAAGSGKSTLLHTIICGLVMNYHPDELELWLLDFKMTELKKYEIHRPPHIKYLLLEKSEDLVFDILDKLDYELTKRKFVFSQNNWHKLSDVPIDYYMPVIFVIIDEFAQMSQILRETKGSGVGSDYAMKLENILREGRAVGFKFIFSSQTYSDGVEGLTESAKKQIQQRIAMKNTYQEIKDTLDLNSDEITSTIQNSMSTLPPYESLFKWKTTDGKVRVEHLRNMYTEYDEVDIVVDKIASCMSDVEHIDYKNNNKFVNKNPILIDGSSPKSFKSQVPYYKRYETPNVIDELDDDDVLIYPGVPCSFNLARPFTLVNASAENILITGGDRENELSVVLSVFSSYARMKLPIEIWSNDRNSIYKRYKTTVLGKYEITTDLGGICSRIDEIKKNVFSRQYDNRLIMVLGYENIMTDMELMGECVNEAVNNEEVVMPDLEPPEDISQVLARIKSCDNNEEKVRIREEFNAKVTEYNSKMADYEARKAAMQNKKGRGIYDARDDMEWMIKRASVYGVHFMFCFEKGKDFIDTKLDERAFRHKITFSMSRDESMGIIGSRKANEIEAGVCLYTNGKDTFSMHPHLYYGVPCNGWQIDDEGNVVKRRY